MLKEGIIKAYEYSQKMHEGQLRKFSGLPYFSHPKAVARIVEQLTSDEIMVIVALLHDTVEDTDATIEDIEQLFGREIASLVGELTSRRLKNGERKADFLKTKMMNMSPKALTIKLVDRFHNVKYLEGDNVYFDFIKKYYKETREIINFLKEQVEFNDVQNLLIGRIEIILNFLELRYNL